MTRTELERQYREKCRQELAKRATEAQRYDWARHARANQLPPDGDWRGWLLLAGRGFGKTRAGAEWIKLREKAGVKGFALVGSTASDARDVMVEGESGLLSIYPQRERPRYQPAVRRVIWPSGARATLYSADEPERLRGPQHEDLWCDEIGSWRYPEAWDMLMFGLRLGQQPLEDLCAVLKVREGAGIIVGLDRDVFDADMLLMVLVGEMVVMLSCRPCRSSWQPRPGISRFTVAPKLSM
jgi:phage terminase large subunit-like protein